MTTHHFNAEIRRLVATYGNKAYPDERIKVLWAEFKSCADWEFTEMVTTLIGSCSMPPMVSKFKEAQGGIEDRQQRRRLLETRQASLQVMEQIQKHPENYNSFEKAAYEILQERYSEPVQYKGAIEFFGLAKLESAAAAYKLKLRVES